jgi:cytochrome P450
MKVKFVPLMTSQEVVTGRDFALLEAQLVLAVLAQRCRLDLAAGRTIEPEPLITLRPRHDILMTLHTR